MEIYVFVGGDSDNYILIRKWLDDITLHPVRIANNKFRFCFSERYVKKSKTNGISADFESHAIKNNVVEFIL